MKRVLVVDDSALARRLIAGMLQSDPELEVVDTARDPYDARDKIKKYAPDVVTLDVEMPRMDGNTFLANLMRLHPLPVVMVSSLTERGADTTLQALELGAVDFVTKPKVGMSESFEAQRDELIAKVKAAARARVRPLRRVVRPRTGAAAKGSADVAPAVRSHRLRTTEQIIALGASTGGTEAVKEVLCALPPDAPGVVIAQHLPEFFSARWTQRLDAICALRVREARDGQRVTPGHVYVAPGSRHLTLTSSGARYYCCLSDGPPVNRHRPSVDVLFASVAEAAGANAVGALLTGMGDDGARGLREMLDAGASTLAQDEASSVVWGMPGAAVALGAAEQVLPLREIAQALLAASESE